MGLSVTSFHRLRLTVWLYDCCRWGCLSLPSTDCVRLFGCTTAACGVVCHFLPPIASGCLVVRLLPVGLSVASFHRLRQAVWLYDYCCWGCLSLPATDYVWPFGCTTTAGGVVCHFLPPIASDRLAVRLLPVGLSVTGRLAVRLLPVGLSVASFHRLRLAIWLYDYCRWGCLSLPATDYVWPFGCTTTAGGVVCHFLPPIASDRLAVRLLPVGLSVTGRLAVRLLPVGLSVASFHRLRLAIWLYDYCRWGCLSLPATDYVWPFGCTTTAGGVVCHFLPPIASDRLAVRLLPVGLSVTGRLAVRLLPLGLSVASFHRLRLAIWLYDYCRWGCLSLPATDYVWPFGCTTTAGGVVCHFLPPIASDRLAVRLLPVGLSVTGRLAVRLLPVGLSVASFHRLRLAIWLYDYCRWGCLSLPATDYVRPFGCTTTAVGVVCRFLPPIMSGRLAVRLLPVGLSVTSFHRLRLTIWLYDCCRWGCLSLAVWLYDSYRWGCLSLPSTDCVWPFGCMTTAGGVVCRFLPLIMSGHLAV